MAKPPAIQLLHTTKMAKHPPIELLHTTKMAKPPAIQLYHPLRPVLDHSSDYTDYGNSLPKPCPPPSNLSATAWEKTDQKFLPGKVTMHSSAPRCDSLKVRPMALSERKRGYWQLKTGLQRGTYIAEQKKKIITPISAVDKKKVYKTSKLQMATENLRVWHIVV